MLCLQCTNFFEVKIASTESNDDNLVYVYRCQKWPELFEQLHTTLTTDRFDELKHPRIVKCTHFEVKSKTH